MIFENKKRKFIVSLLISYFLVLVIPIFVGFLVYHEVIKIVKEEAREYNIAALEQAMKITDSRMEEIENSILQLTINPNIRYFNSIFQPFESNSYFRMWETLKDITPYTLTNDFIIDFAVYFTKSDIVLSSNSVYSLRSFYNSYFKDSSVTFSDWSNDILKKRYDGKLIPSIPVIINGKRHEIICYVQTIPIGYPNQSDGFIMALIDIHQVNDILKGAVTGEQGYIYIMDQNGDYMTGVSKGGFSAVPVAVDLNARKGFSDRYSNGQRMTITYTTSDYNGWVYVVAIPTRSLMNKVDYIRNIIFAVTALSLIIGILSAYALARKNARPLKDIIELLKRTFRYSTDENIRNEYSFLKGSIAELIENNQSLQQEVEKQKPVLETVFFNRLFKGEFNDREEMEAFQSSIGLQIYGNLFAIMLIKIKGYEGLTNEEALNELDASRVIVKDILDSCLMDTACHYIDRDKIAVLVAGNANKETDFEGQIKNMSNDMYHKAWQRYNIRLSFYLGNIYTDLAEVFLSFEEAKCVLDYYYDKEEGQFLIPYSQMQRENRQYNYSMESEIRLANMVKAGNRQELEKMLKELYRDNFIKIKLTNDMKSQLLFEMRGTIIKLSEQLDFYELFEQRIRMMDCNGDIEKTYEMMMEAYLDLCDMVNQRKTGNALKLKEKIMKYINVNFTDSNLSLAGIAFELNLTEQYLSQFFKRQTGQNFSNYLEKIRIDYSCDLLRNPGCSVNDISYRAGYNSDKTFRRAFKRVKGISPTEFRREMKNSVV
jgi:AraC-like DNA-binding protein